MGGVGRKVLGGGVLSLVAAVSVAATTSTASAEVLVTAIPPTLRCGAPVRVGVWYQRLSGGPRWARIIVRAHSGRLLWKRTTNAKMSWRYWYVYPLCGEHYVLTYTTARGTTRFSVDVK